MKRKCVLFIVIWVLFILQSTVFKFLQIADTSPNLLLILTVSIGFMQGKKEGLFTGFLCGLLFDLFYGSVFGFYALLYMYVGYGCGHLCDIYFDEDIKVPLILITVCDFLFGTTVFLTRFLLRGRFNYGGYLLHVIMPEIVYTIILTLILYRILYLINRKLASAERGISRNIWL
ncbi:MAG: rod shape-determining protein MreD [Lachnospiraceae bacterium]|nr:rod shape-determining protein MreD [Lachnospiraceae bacterium]